MLYLLKQLYGELYMRNSTLCYIEKDNCYLMLHRIKKENDINKNKWIGVGGGFLDGESPEECCLREIKEETGLNVRKLHFRGIITFVTDNFETEYMHLFTCSDFEGEIIDCNEGVLRWVPKNEIFDLELWEGDKIFLNYLFKDLPFFSLKLVYNQNKLIEYKMF